MRGGGWKAAREKANDDFCLDGIIKSVAENAMTFVLRFKM